MSESHKCSAAREEKHKKNDALYNRKEERQQMILHKPLVLKTHICVQTLGDLTAEWIASGGSPRVK